MRHRYKFWLKTLAVFVITTVIVGVLIYIADNFDQTGTVNIFSLTLIVMHTVGEIIDPREIREKRATILVLEKDIEKIKDDISFLKYIIQKETDMEFGELHLKSSIWKDLELEETEEHEEVKQRRGKGS